VTHSGIINWKADLNELSSSYFISIPFSCTHGYISATLQGSFGTSLLMQSHSMEHLGMELNQQTTTLLQCPTLTLRAEDSLQHFYPEHGSVAQSVHAYTQATVRLVRQMSYWVSMTPSLRADTLTTSWTAHLQLSLSIPTLTKQCVPSACLL